MDDCKNAAANCENWRELYEKEHKKLLEHAERVKEEHKERLAAAKYGLMLQQQELKLKNGNDIKVPIPRDNYCYGVCCEINKENESLVEFKEFEALSYTLQPLIDKINSLQTYKLAEGDTDILVSRDDVIKILKGEYENDISF